MENNDMALPTARATHEPSPDGLGHSVGVSNADDDGILRSKARALARSVWDERNHALPFDGMSFESRDLLIDCCLKGICVGIIGGSDLVRSDTKPTRPMEGEQP